MKKLLKAVFSGLGTGLLVFILIHSILFLIGYYQPAFINMEYFGLVKTYLSDQTILHFSLAVALFVFATTLIHNLNSFLQGAITMAAAFLLGFWLFNNVPDLRNLWTQAVDTLKQTEKEKDVYDTAQVFNYEGYPPLKVLSNEPFSQERADEIFNYAIANQPRFLLEKCSAIYLMDVEHFSKEAESLNQENIVGLANSSDMAIRILIKDFNEPYIDSSTPEIVMQPLDYYTNTITHELSHLYDYGDSNAKNLISDQDDFKTLFNDYGTTLNSYGASSNHEFFAEGSRYYFLYPDLLSQKCWPLYQYYEALYTQSQSL